MESGVLGSGGGQTESQSPSDQAAEAWRGNPQEWKLLLCSWLAVQLRARAVATLTLRLFIPPVSMMETGSLEPFDHFEMIYAGCPVQ